MQPPDISFCKALPKVELHAHLTGSITKPILQEIWNRRSASDPSFNVESPETALSDGAGQSISTFFGHFNTYLYKLVSDLPSLLFATRAVLKAFQEDGVCYFELRTTPRSIGTTPRDEVVAAIIDLIEKWNDKEPMRVGLILSIDIAKHDTETAISIVNLASFHQQAGRPVLGVDLCGDPHNVRDITIFREPFQLAKQKGLGIVLHFAEVPQISTREILEEMLSWRPNRLGHVIHVPQDLRERIRAQKIGVELCLTCNVLAGMLPSSGGYEQHHFGEWWSSSEEPIMSLGTDDVGVFGSKSSEEYLLAAQHFGLSRSDLIKLSRCALKGSLGDCNTANGILDAFEKTQ